MTSDNETDRIEERAPEIRTISCHNYTILYFELYLR